MSKHTPGPWVTSPEPNGKEWVVDAGPWGICICADAPGLGSAEANARLIAAAPELLEALQAVTRCLAWHEEQHGVGMDRKAVESARSAITKATGA